MIDNKTMNPSNDSISVVIPAFNAENTIADLIEKLEQVLTLFKEYEIIIVDDFSTDSTKVIISEFVRKNERIRAFRLARNYGQQMAVLIGLRHAKSDYTVTIDDDLEQNPRDILLLYKVIKQGYDVVYGINRKSYQKGSHRVIGSMLRDFLFERLTNIPKDIKVCSFRILSRETSEKVVQTDFKKPYISMEILKHTNNIMNVEVEYNYNSDSGYNIINLITLFFNIFLYYSPIKLFDLFRKKGNNCEEVSL